MSHLNDGLDYGSIIGIDCDITHERLIDFEFINLELLEIAQRGIPAPKSSLDMRTPRECRECKLSMISMAE